MKRFNLKNGITIIVLFIIIYSIWNFYASHTEINLDKEVVDVFKFQGALSPTFKPIDNKDLKLLKQLADNLYGFNIIKSQELSANRDIPDTRPLKCKDIIYENNQLNPVSIIIPVFNELYSVLVRTVATVISRSPEDLISEIILVNDFSTYHDTSLALDRLVKSFSKVVVHKLDSRQGLIRAKIVGSSLAKAEILVFLDSHTEVNIDWLPPLLSTISKNPMTKVVVPTIDMIHPETFEYNKSPLVRGGFNWGLYFTWLQYRNSDINSIDPISTPTFSGGYFAMSKKMYYHFGGYDPEMRTWGGENLEMSFRVWQCGGTIEILPCSRVGHIFRPKRPYAEADGENHWLSNTLRMSHVWMDDYIERFYKIRPDARHFNYGSIRLRKQLREDLNCHSFKWYLENVFPEMLNEFG